MCTVNFKSKTVFDDHLTQKHGPSILSTNKIDVGYRKISSTRKYLALFHLCLKLSSVYCQLQIENCFWWTFNSKTWPASLLSTNKTDDVYRKMFCKRQNLALFHLSLKLSSVCTVNFKSKTVFDEHLAQKHTFLFCILNINWRQLTLDT